MQGGGDRGKVILIAGGSTWLSRALIGEEGEIIVIARGDLQ